MGLQSVPTSALPSPVLLLKEHARRPHIESAVIVVIFQEAQLVDNYVGMQP